VDPIANIDQLVLVLRRRLLERSQADKAAFGKQRRPDRQASALDSVYALARIDGADDRQLRRGLIQSILAEQFGSSVINEAKFQQVVDRVVDTMEADATASKLLAVIVHELRDAAR
jgi:hypothetical protein